MGLNINCKSWPQSDIEMIDKTYFDYIASDEPFLVYYMTVSGHFDYTFNDNYIASKNRNLVKNLPYSEKPQAYIACNIELDRALELLISKLEEYGKLDDTVIVLLADHYPYALSLSEINELSSYERDDLFEINHNSLILWNSKMENESIDKVGMPIDVIPTIYNLFGIDYDSRLFAGTDLLSDKEGIVILGNRSWITNKGRYNSTNIFFEGVASEEYIEHINIIIQNKVAFSKGIFTNNGYTYIKQENISN
jgi:phosphoglycerol transferase MdoB-like AlkP superfamily enzyme